MHHSTFIWKRDWHWSVHQAFLPKSIPTTLSTYSHFYIIIKSKVGVDFDVPLWGTTWGTSKSTPTLFVFIKTL